MDSRLDEENIVESLVGAKLTEASRQGTAKQAIRILEQQPEGYCQPTADQRLNIAVAFQRKRKVVYGQAFDVVRCEAPVNLDDDADVYHNVDKIVLCEVKSTNRKNVDEDFNGYFFALTAAELLVAQSLKNQYRFVLVNTLTKTCKELTLRELLSKAKGIYQTWSIQF